MGVCIAVFAKAPIPGVCKTRLAAFVGDDAAARLHRAMLLDTLAALEKAGADRLVLLAAPENDGVRVLRDLAPPGWEIVVQHGSDFGARLANGMAELTQGGDAAIITDGDSPTLPIAPLTDGLRHLRQAKRGLLGRATDGGYYLVGLSAHEPEVFCDIEWSTSAVAAQTREKLDEIGYETLELPSCPDVDVVDDLRELHRQLDRHPELAPRTADLFAREPSLGERIVAIIPALDEAATIGQIVAEVRPHVDRVIVADNGSQDDTVRVAADAGAEVTVERRRGYGAACLAGVELAERFRPTIALFLDADGSEDPADAPRLLEPVLAGRADLALGIRTADTIEPGAMTGPQRFGNWLAPTLMRWTLGTRYVDMPPYKAIRWNALTQLALTDRGHGFTVELLIRAHLHRLQLEEVVVHCRARRGGASKVSGTLRGSVRAAGKILYTVGYHGLRARWS